MKIEDFPYLKKISEDQKLIFINIVLSNLIIFGKYKI